MRELFVKLIGKDKLLCIRGINNDIDSWVSAWISELNNTYWFNQVELRSSFPRMDCLNDSVCIFPISSSNYSVKVTLCFKRSIALITEITSDE